MTRVIVHIDRLVLKGVRHRDGDAIGEGLRQELARVLADPQLTRPLAALGSVPRLRVEQVHVAPGSPPQRVGEGVARGIAREIKK